MSRDTTAKPSMPKLSGAIRHLHDATKAVGLLSDERAISLALLKQVTQVLGAPERVVLLAHVEAPGSFSAVAAHPATVMDTWPVLEDVSVNLHCLVDARRPIEARDLLGIDESLRQVLRGWAFAPLDVGDRVIGLIGVRGLALPLRAAQLELFCALASIGGVAIEQVRQRDRAVSDERKLALLARHFPAHLAERLVTGDGPPEPMRATASILLSDIRGFTALSEHTPPGRVFELLNRYFRDMTALVFAHGGMVDKLMGDGLLAVFGAPTPLENHALSALRCGAGMIRSARELDVAPFGLEHLRIGVGVASGEILLGDVGGGSFLDYTALGHPVNLAARLENLTKATGLDLLFDDLTRELAGDAAPSRSLGATAVAGFDEPIVLHTLVDRG